MTASALSYFTYPNSDFTSLGGNPINNAILAQEIEDDATVTLPVQGVTSQGTDTRIILEGNATAAMASALDAVVAAHEGGNFAVFPQNSTADSETNEGDTGTETTKVSHNTGLMPAGTYLVLWYMEVKLSADGGSSAGVLPRLKVGGTEQAISATEKAQYVAFSGAKRLTVDDGAEYDIDLTFQRSGSSGYTGYARRASIDVTRIF